MTTIDAKGGPATAAGGIVRTRRTAERETAQTVLVTAGGAGIGRAIAEAFADSGARVHVCDVDPEALQALQRARPEIGGTVADVADRRAVARLYGEVDARLGRIDVLVNNAGVGGPRGSVDTLDEDAWDRTIAVNLSGAFYVTKPAVARMRAQGSGCIVNISTASVRTGLPGRTAYVASKHGLMGFTQNLARELGPAGIRCNAILPGMIDNPRGRALVEHLARERNARVEDVEAAALRYISMRTWIEPREVGAIAVFLASEAARHVTGQFLGVCGGAEWEE